MQGAFREPEFEEPIESEHSTEICRVGSERADRKYRRKQRCVSFAGYLSP